MAAGQRAVENASAPTRKRDAVRRIFDILGAHVGFGRLAVKNRAARVSRKRRDARIVGVQHGGAVRRQRLDQLALGRGDAFDRIEKFDVRVADVGHHADVRLGDRGQLANLARVIHSDFEHRDARASSSRRSSDSGSPT